MFKRLLLLAVALLCAGGFGHVLAASDIEYCVEVDVTNQITTVYRLSDRAIVRQMICSTGTGTKTPLGTFRLEAPRPGADREPWYYISKYGCYVKYATRIKGSILFHSIPYSDKEMSAIDQEALAQLGTKASHGCIRLRWEDAEWIAEHCPQGTEVNIYNGAAKREALRQRLLEEGYVRDDGLSYDQYLSTGRVDDGDYGFARGASGDDVSALQRKLVGLGFMSGEVTGEYDDATVLAVMRYQSASGLTVSGVSSRALTERIMGEKDAVAEYATLTKGCEGTLVAKAQRVLRDLGFYDGDIDGHYGEALDAAAAAFCGVEGMAYRQSLTPAARDAAYRLLDGLENRYGKGGFAMRYTESGKIARLRRDTPLYGAPDAAAGHLAELPSGATVRLTDRVGRWRRVEYEGWSGYVPSGRLGDIVQAGPSAHWGRNVTDLGAADMGPGDMGDGVLALQRRLADLGYYNGADAPLYSLATASAVEQYQYDAGLEITGTASQALQRTIAADTGRQGGVEETGEGQEYHDIGVCEPVSEDLDDAPVEFELEDAPLRPAWLRKKPVGI